MSPNLENLEYLEKSGNFKRPLENLELSGNFILTDRSQGKMKMSKLLYLYICKECYFFSNRKTSLKKKSHFHNHILAPIHNYIINRFMTVWKESEEYNAPKILKFKDEYHAIAIFCNQEYPLLPSHDFIIDRINQECIMYSLCLFVRLSRHLVIFFRYFEMSYSFNICLSTTPKKLLSVLWLVKQF